MVLRFIRLELVLSEEQFFIFYFGGMLPHVLRMQIKEFIFAVTRLGANIPEVCDS